MRKTEKNKNTEKQSVLLSDSTSFAVTESYKEIRTNILHILRGDERKCFAVTSPCPGTGKTTVAVNLGISFAQLGKKTVVIDADMRKPMVAKLFQINADSGLSEYLSGKVDTVKAFSTKYQNFYAVPSGAVPDNPSELLSSERFVKLMDRLNEEYDYVIVDTPPLGMVTDAAVVTGCVLGTLLVIKQNYTDKERFDDTVESLKRVDAKILGYVLNAVDESKYSYKYGRYSSYYGGYYGHE